MIRRLSAVVDTERCSIIEGVLIGNGDKIKKILKTMVESVGALATRSTLSKQASAGMHGRTFISDGGIAVYAWEIKFKYLFVDGTEIEANSNKIGDAATWEVGEITEASRYI